MVNDIEEAIACLAEVAPTLVVTRSEAWRDRHCRAASGPTCPAEPIERLVDTTGAGDLFAAGFLAGQARGLGLKASLKLGAIAAAEVIQHYGARPEKDLKALAGGSARIRKGRPRRRTRPFRSSCRRLRAG